MPATPFALLTHDRSALGVADGIINASDGAGLASCLSGPDVPVDPSCAPGGSPAGPSNVPPILRTGDFGLHGRPVDVLADGKVLMYWRNRWYDPAHGRFLQRDPTGYADGPNLYEAFRSNSLRFVDPDGLDAWWLGMAYRWAGRNAGDNALGRWLVSQGEEADDQIDGGVEALNRLFGDAHTANSRQVMAVQNAMQGGINLAIRRRQYSRAAAIQAELGGDFTLSQDFEAVQTDLSVQAAGMATSLIPAGPVAAGLSRTTAGAAVNSAGSAATTAIMNTTLVKGAQRAAQVAAASTAISVGATNLPRVTVGAWATDAPA